jgi:hypothetical protein
MRKPFAESLRDLRGGAVIEECERQLQELLVAVGTTGKKGTFTLKLTVSPTERSGGLLIVTDQINSAPPQEETNGTAVFLTPEGNWQRNNPKQEVLPGIELAPARGVANG